MDTFFNQGYMDSDNIYEKRMLNTSLNSLYDSPEEVDLYELFYNGLGITVEEEERAFVEAQGAFPDLDIVKLPKSEMDNILTKYFGLTLEETAQTGLENFYYNEATDTYYLVHSDSKLKYVNILEEVVNEDEVLVTYTLKATKDAPEQSEKRCVTLRRTEDGYLFVKNVVVEE